MRNTEWEHSRSSEFSDFNYTIKELNEDLSKSTNKARIRSRFHVPTKSDIKNILHPNKPVFGKDGPRGSWYIRIPLWMQSTILIFFIGFLSLLVLTIVSAVQVWSYTESLMKTRLSTLAGMTGIEVEQGFDSLERSITSSTSSTSSLNFISAANNNMSMSRYWDSFNKEFGVELSLSDCLAMELYDKNLRLVYSYRKRTSTGRLPGQQNNLLPKELFPLSHPDLRDDMLANLDRTNSGVLANATANQIYPSTRSVNITYSVTQKISASPPLNIYDISNLANDTSSRSDYAGYSTFVLKNEVTSSIVKEKLFSQYIIEIVRLNDIVMSDLYGNSINNASFAFLYPFISENGTINPQQNWSVSTFPVLTDAINLALRSYDEPSLGSSPTQQPTNHSTQFPDPNNVKLGTHIQSDHNKKPPLNVEIEKVFHSKSSGNSSAFSRFNNSSPNSNTTSSSTNSGQGDIPSLYNLSITTNKSSSAKTDSAHMKTKAPFDNKSSIGYSYANIYDQKWLIFIQIPESEAFNDARHLRNVIIAVGAGILGAVLLLLLPLSRWQTRGFYIIYQNMKLRPVFILDNAASENDTEETANNALGDDLSSQDEKPEIQPLAGEDSQNSSIQKSSIPSYNAVSNSQSTKSNHGKKRDGISPTNSSAIKSGAKQDTEHGSRQTDSRLMTISNHKDSMNFEASSLSYDKRRYRFDTPTPLPPLNRWFSDEVDDLISEYNNMTEKLNAYYLHLEDQVRIRTHEAQKARELREEANAAKSEFIAIISHELRTPLNGIMGLTAVNADEEDVTKIQSSLRIIIESGHVLMDLLNELLELSKSLVGVEPSVSEFTPAELLDMLPRLFSPRAPALTTRFALATVPHTLADLKLRGDVDHIAHICINFMSNAMKFSDQNGDVSVILHLRPLNDPLINLAPYGTSLENANAVLEILVTDSGVGISKPQLAKIFDLFVQGEDPLRKNQKGVGLGMALSKQLAEGIGGYIAVFSAKDVGTTTVLHIPVEAVGLSDEEVISYNGPPIEFKVHDVFCTISLKAGEVQLVQEKLGITHHSPSSTQEIAANTLDSHSSQRKSKHTHQHSAGSRLLLTRSHPVSKLLRAQSLHQHNHSQYSSKSHGSQGSGRTEGTSEISTPKGSNGLTINPALPAVIGIHANHSASSLLLNIPDGLFDDKENVRSSVISIGTEYFESSQPQSERNSPTPVPASSQQASAIQNGPAIQRQNSARLRIIPPRPNNLTRDDPTSTSTSKSMQQDLTPSTAASDSTVLKYYPSDSSASPQEEINKDARILLAEDNLLNQEIMVKMLHHIGITHVDTAGDGDTVIQLVEKSIIDGFHYSIIFMDLSMPEMNGIEATQVIRGTLGYPYPIVALTGFSDIQTRNACKAVNIQEVLTKPVMKYDILRVLQKYSKVSRF